MREDRHSGYPPARWRGGSSEAAKLPSEGWGGYACSDSSIENNTPAQCVRPPPTPDPSPPRAARAGGGEQDARS
jgi:hypothetical protein